MAISIFAWLDWKTLKTDNFTVYYKPGYEWEAGQALQNLERYRGRAVDITGNALGSTAVVIEDVGTLPNGFANPLYRDVHLFTYPPQGGELDMTQNWYRTVGFHEYVHMAHMRKTSGMAKLFADAFGTIFQPNMYSPGWIVEGMTVYSESQLSPYEGRLNDGFFDAFIAARASQNKLPSIVDATYTPLEFPYGTGFYLYGGEFFDYVGTKYGEDSFRKLFKIYGSCFPAPCASCVMPACGIEIAARKTFGRSLPSLFNEWRGFETGRNQSWRIDGQALTDQGWFFSHLTVGAGKLYYVRDHPRKTDALSIFYFTEIIEHDVSTGKKRAIVRLTSSVSAPIKVEDQHLYYATSELGGGYANVSQYGLGIRSYVYRRDLEKSTTKRLFSDGLRCFAPFGDSQVIYSKDRAHDFGSELWRYQAGKKEKLGEFDYLIGEIETDAGEVVISARRDNENWDLYRLNLETMALSSLLATPWSETDIRLGRDTLFFTANYRGVYSIYCLALGSGQVTQLTEGGFSRSGVVVESTLYFTGLNPKGFDIYCRPVAHKVFEPRDGPAPEEPNAPVFEPPHTRGGYLDVAKSFVDPDVRVPVLFPGDSTLKSWYMGAVLVNTDAPNENTALSFVAYDWANEDLMLNTSIQSLLFLPVLTSVAYDHGNSIEGGIELPLYSRLNRGLTSVSCGVSAAAWSDSVRNREQARRAVGPYAAAGFTFPYTNLDLTASLVLERQSFGSDIDRTVQYANIWVRQYLAGGELRPSVRGFTRESGTGWMMIRGDSLAAQSGGIVTLEYSHPLLRIRKGLWNPNIYFEDLCGTVFVDGCLSRNGDYKYSGGVELKLEVGMLMGYFKWAPILGFAVNRDGDRDYYFRASADVLGSVTGLK